MPKNDAVAVGVHFAEVIERQVSQGHYGSATDVVQAGLRLLEEREAKLEALRAALIEGEQSRPSTSFDFDEFIEEQVRSELSSK
jgi:antitoxin ParD1/3/4